MHSMEDHTLLRAAVNFEGRMHHASVGRDECFIVVRWLGGICHDANFQGVDPRTNGPDMNVRSPWYPYSFPKSR